MALSRAAAAAARKAAKNRGLKGNRADDGSLLSFDKERFVKNRREHVIKELGGDEKGRLPDPNEKFAAIDETNPDAIKKELASVQEDIVYWEDGLESLTDDYEILLVQTRLRRLRNREVDLVDMLESFDELDMLRKIEIEDAANIEKG